MVPDTALFLWIINPLKRIHITISPLLLRRVLEVRCYDAIVRMDEQLQMNYTSEAIHWFIDYLNLTAVIKERNDSSPWSWYGSMFYAGQLYTTIGKFLI
uniref:Uncharacterized protein n=1 Tax=Parascaris equorum TaxID=6256 RepID=A0A914R5Z6_PAREQ